MPLQGGGNPNAVLEAPFGGFLAVPSALSSASSTVLIPSGFHTLWGYQVSEVGGAASQTVSFYDGATSSSANTNFGRVNLTLNQTVTNWFAPGGINASSGQLYLAVGVGGPGTPSGLVAGVVFYQ